MAECRVCGKKIGFLEGKTDDLGRICSKCIYESPEEVEAETKQAALEARIEKILATTEMQPDIAIRERMGIVTAEVAYGMNVFKDLFSSVRNIVGGRSEAVKKTMQDSRDTVLYELKKAAHERGANAVVGVNLSYTQIGDSGWSMVLVVATGTAVIIANEGGSQAD